MHAPILPEKRHLGWTAVRQRGMELLAEFLDAFSFVFFIGSLFVLSFCLLFPPVLRWPIGFFFTILLSIELIAYALLRALISLFELFRNSFARSLRISVRTGENCDNDYKIWASKALELDELDGLQAKKETDWHPAYNSVVIRKLYNKLIHLQKQPKSNTRDEDLLLTLKACLRKNVGGIMNEALYSQTNIGSKVLIEMYTAEVVNALRVFAEETSFPITEKVRIIKDFKRSYGHTALCLSGGGGMGLYHWGVLKELLKQKLIPRIISGASAGSIVAAHVCTRTDKELEKTMNVETLTPLNQFACGYSQWQKLVSYVTKGHCFPPEGIMKSIDAHTKGMTFKEAYMLTGRVLVIPATAAHHHEPPISLSYLTTPNILISSACLASSSIPGVIPAMDLYEKDPQTGEIRKSELSSGLRDGSFKADLPTGDLSYFFNCSYFIVSQCNPHLAPFFFYSQGDAGKGFSRWTGWRGGYVLAFLESFLKNELRKNLTIMRDMGMLPTVLGADLSYLFLQNVEGNVTLVPPVAISDYINLLNSPDIPSMTRYISQGQMMVWRKKSLLDTRLLIGETLNEVLDNLTGRGSIYWVSHEKTNLTMPSLVLPALHGNTGHVPHESPAVSPVDSQVPSRILRSVRTSRGRKASPVETEIERAPTPTIRTRSVSKKCT